MRVAVTGGLGKLGQAVVDELVAETYGRGHEVTVFDRISGPRMSGPRPSSVQYLIGDITDLGQVFGALAGADAVIHLAGIYSHGITTNEVTFRTNVMGTFNVHEAAWRLGIKRVVTMSSEAVLGWAPGSWTREVVPEYLPIDEDHPCVPQDCYGLSKVAAEAIARSYTQKCGMETIAIRPPWIVSPEELHKLGQTGGMTQSDFRMYHYIDARDLAEACRLAVERPITGATVLFVGSGESTVAEPLATLYPRLMPAIGDKAAALTGTRAAVSIERARQVLGWSPRRFWRTNAAGN